MVGLSKTVLLSVTGVALARTVTGAWSHTWDTASEAYWGDFGYSLLTEPQAEFLATNYKIVSVEKCSGYHQGVTTEVPAMKSHFEIMLLFSHSAQIHIFLFLMFRTPSMKPLRN